MKNFLLLITSLFFLNSIDAQDTIPSKVFTLNFGLGGALTSFQDTKFSDVHYSGVGIASTIEFTWQKKGILSTGIESVLSSENPKTFDHGKTNVYQGLIYAKYLYPIKKTDNYNLYIGAKIDAYDFYLRKDKQLTNNSNYFIQSSNFKVATMYQRKLNDKWFLKADLGFQFFSLLSENMSFGYSVNQRTIENGNYNYDSTTTKMYFTPFWEYLNLETTIRFHYKKNWTFSYLWRMQQSYLVDGYPMTKGYSAITASFNIINRSK